MLQMSKRDIQMVCIITCAYSSQVAAASELRSMCKREKVLFRSFYRCLFCGAALYECWGYVSHSKHDYRHGGRSPTWRLGRLWLNFASCYSLFINSSYVWYTLVLHFEFKCRRVRIERWLWPMCTPSPLVRWSESRQGKITAAHQVRPRYVWNVSRWISTIISTTTQNSSGGGVREDWQSL